MMHLGLDYNIILDVYFKEIRTIIEYGAVIYNSGLTIKLSNKLEKIQQLVLRLVSNYIGVKCSYSIASILFSVEPLSSRRLELSYRLINASIDKTLP